MTDDVKAAIEWLRESSLRGRATRPELTRAEVEALLAHIEGEPARIAAAREEQRESCARVFETTMEQAHDLERDDVDPVLTVRAAPLDATPLADEIAALLARIAELEAEAECQVDGRPQCKAPDYCHACAIALERRAVAQLRAERDEVVKALRGYVTTAYASDPHDYLSRAEVDAAMEAERRADEVLAKYPEGK